MPVRISATLLIPLTVARYTRERYQAELRLLLHQLQYILPKIGLSAQKWSTGRRFVSIPSVMTLFHAIQNGPLLFGVGLFIDFFT